VQTLYFLLLPPQVVAAAVLHRRLRKPKEQEAREALVAVALVEIIRLQLVAQEQQIKVLLVELVLVIAPI
jgi:hypothetical protein